MIYSIWAETDWHDCLTYTGAENSTQTLTPSFQYFQPFSKSRVVSISKTSCDGNWSGTSPPYISVSININHAAHYSETYKAIIQLFVYKDDDDNYHGYGQADIGLPDYTVVPSGLSEKPDLSSALEVLATTADSNSISAAYYR